MKKALMLLALITLTHSCVVRADSIEVLGGSITEHLENANGAASYNAHKLSGDGRLIANPMMGLRLMKENDRRYDAYTVFGGQNSPGFAMGGTTVSTGWKFSGFYAGLVGGFYLQSDSKFLATGEIPFKWFKVNGTDFVPVFGCEINYKVDLTDKVYVKVNNLITPILTNSSVSVGLTF